MGGCTQVDPCVTDTGSATCSPIGVEVPVFPNTLLGLLALVMLALGIWQLRARVSL